MTELVVADIGGTNARFALAEVARGRVVSLGNAVTLPTAAHGSLQRAWQAFAAHVGHPLPRAASLAVAGPVQGEVLRFTNNPWVLRPALIPERLGADQWTLVNDFSAVGHAVAQVGAEHLRHLCGPDVPLPDTGIVSIVGPGTGLGVAHVLRTASGYHVSATEGGHVDFAPLDRIEDAILAHLRRTFVRVSAERIVSGPGLANIHAALAAIEAAAVPHRDDRALWTAALSGTDSLASAALDRFCLSLGAIAGDIALAQGGTGVVIAGGLGLRIADHLPASGFGQRFAAKGRFQAMMAAIPVKLITHPQPGLYGAAAAFAQEHCPS